MTIIYWLLVFYPKFRVIDARIHLARLRKFQFCRRAGTIGPCCGAPSTRFGDNLRLGRLVSIAFWLWRENRNILVFINLCWGRFQHRWLSIWVPGHPNSPKIQENRITVYLIGISTTLVGLLRPASSRLTEVGLGWNRLHRITPLPYPRKAKRSLDYSTFDISTRRAEDTQYLH